MTRDNPYMRMLGEELRELAPLIKAAVQALDQKGTRALRRKLDGGFNSTAHSFNAAWRSSFPMNDMPMGDYVEYDRVTPHRWGGRKHATEHQVDLDDLQGINRTPCQVIEFPKECITAIRAVREPDYMMGQAARACGRSPIRGVIVDNDGGDHAA